MAVDAFLKLIDRSGKPVLGESIATGHTDEIEVLSWSWGAAQTGTAAGGPAGKAQNVNMSLMKYLDRSSMPLFVLGASGKGLQTAQLTLRKAGTRTLEYLVITMTDVFVTSQQEGAASGGDRPTESISLQFGKVEVKYQAQKPDGSLGDTVKVRWDFAKNVQV